MQNCDSFFTVEQPGADEFTEKKSRFIGYAAPVSTVDEALEFVKNIKSKHNDARHNCFAYSLKSGEMRYSDDGEPQGTAGQPILEVMTRGDICDCVVVVTRYFGGVLLGTGGLTRAYTNGAKQAVAAANIIEMTRVLCCTLICDYTFYGSVQTFAAKFGALTENSEYADNITLDFLILPCKFDAFNMAITELSAGKLKLLQKGEKYINKKRLK